MDARLNLSRLIGVIHAGEDLAAKVASRQARLAAESWMRRALEIQAIQERGHAAAAAAVAAMVGIDRRAPRVLTPIGVRLEADLDTGDLTASLLGLQGVVEHLGQALLERLGRHPHPGGALLHALRERVLAQERGHTRLGAKCLAALAVTDSRSRDQALADYEALGLETAYAVAALFDDARLDADGYWREVQAQLAAWRGAGGKSG